MDVAVQRAPVHGPVEEIVVGILDEEPEDDLRQHDIPAGEGSFKADAKHLHERVEEDNHGHFNGEVDKNDVLDTVPLVGCRGHFLVLDLVSTKDAGQGICDHPWDATAKIYKLVAEKGDQTRGDKGVVPKGIMSPPLVVVFVSTFIFVVGFCRRALTRRSKAEYWGNCWPARSYRFVYVAFSTTKGACGVVVLRSIVTGSNMKHGRKYHKNHVRRIEKPGTINTTPAATTATSC